jgi:primosomal protein N' (replication factor Y)
MTKYVEVILPLALNRSFTYLNHEPEKDLVGCRVIVPFGRNKFYTGIVVDVSQEIPTYAVKSIEEVLDEHPIVSKTQIELWNWIASYYMCGVGEVMRAAMPSALLFESETILSLIDQNFRNRKLTDNQYLLCELLEQQPQKLSFIRKHAEIKGLSKCLNDLIESEVLERFEQIENKGYQKFTPWLVLEDTVRAEEILKQNKAPAQRDLVMQFFNEAKGANEITWLPFAKKYAISTTTRNSLIKKGVFRLDSRVLDRISGKEDQEIAFELSKPQQKAVSEINRGLEAGKPVLLHGLTGSGKTMLYMSFIDQALKEGKQILFLLPEIALTTSLWKRLNKRFSKQVIAYSSSLSNVEKAEFWTKVRENSDEAKVIVGARSSLLLPFNNLGLIIADEEHDPSYKQQDPAPRYQARDLAVYLAHKEDCPIILGSATPSLESLFNAGFGNNKQPKYHYVYLGERFGQSKLPDIKILDKALLRKKKLMKSWLSQPVIDEVSRVLAKNKQVLFFQNRRGFSSLLECIDCGHIPGCKNCDVSLTYHRLDHTLRCHYCGYSESAAHSCTKCHSPSLDKHGLGTQQLEELITALFPNHQVARMDRDTQKGKSGHQRLLEKFENQEIQLLVGTQMVSKGLDFKNIGLVVVVNADQLLHRADYRAHERAFQQLTQVSGRAGRTSDTSKVLIQTFDPNHRVFKSLQNLNESDFIESEFTERRLFNYPPYVRMIKIQFLAKQVILAIEGASWFAKAVRQIEGVVVLGNDAPNIEKIRNQYYQQILIKAPPNYPMHTLKRQLLRFKKSFDNVSGFSKIQVIFHVDHI